jgi:hypothetical protein
MDGIGFMSAPKLTAKLRTKNNIPFAIETLTGFQFRCGVCGKVFGKREELDKHLENENNIDFRNVQFPQINRNTKVSVIYTHDLRDLTNSKYPRLTKGDKLFQPNKTE